MSKRKVHYKKPKIFTHEEMLRECEDYRQMCKANGKEWWFNHEGTFFGYEYHYQFIKLECGWVEAPEMVCEYCVHSVVDNFGSEAERLAFNALAPLGSTHTCWITNSDYAEKRTRDIRRKRRWRNEAARSERNARQKRELIFVEA